MDFPPPPPHHLSGEISQNPGVLTISSYNRPHLDSVHTRTHTQSPSPPPQCQEISADSFEATLWGYVNQEGGLSRSFEVTLSGCVVKSNEKLRESFVVT